METAPEGLLYVPDFLSADEHAALLRQLRALDYQHDSFRGQLLKRGYAQFGYSYVSTGRKLEPAVAIPGFLQAVIDKAQPFCGQCPTDEPFNQCIVTHYPANAGIGWHTDAPRFGECVVGVSVASAARFQFRLNGSEELGYDLPVAAASMYVMQGPARWQYQHQVVPVKTERYSLTFRHVHS